jgi:hypothetical protein
MVRCGSLKLTRDLGRVRVLGPFRPYPARCPPLVAVKRIMRYVQDTMKYGILFPNNINNAMNRLVGFSDSDWCGDQVDIRSTTGYIFKFLNAPIACCSKKQPVLALLSCEAEYIACAYIACQGI